MATDPRAKAKEKKAKREAIALGAAGVLLMFVGLWATYSQPRGIMVLLITLVIFGPVMVFLALISYFSYMEIVEEEDYTPQPQPPQPA